MVRRMETAMWMILALASVSYAFHRYTWPDRYLAALERDGYVITNVIGTNCVVVDATDRDGDQLKAWACTR